MAREPQGCNPYGPRPSMSTNKGTVVVLLRHAPGERCPISGTYALVGHYGEVMGFARMFDKGATFPLVTVSAEGPAWYVLVDVPDVAANAA
jgi:hypothetical protein